MIAGLSLLSAVAFDSQTLTFQTFGGSGKDTATAVAVDASGNVYVAGSTSSFDFPVLNAYQQSNPGTQLVFSPDAGVTWQALPNVAAPYGLRPLIAPDLANADVFYVASGNQVFKTSDGGRHFASSRIVAPAYAPSAITGILADAIDSNIVYASASFGGGVFKSIDGGKTWVNSSAGLPSNAFIESIVADPFRKSLWVWAGSGGYFSTDAGATWTRSASPGSRWMLLSLARISSPTRFTPDGSMP